MLHALFTREHNAICGRLKSLHPGWSDDALYAKARLINAALMTKIHTVEWTPAILAHPYIKIGMNVQWTGLLGERIQDLFKPLNRSDVLAGVIGSETDHYTAPYSMTEEFVAIYRMHPLMPDDSCSVRRPRAKCSPAIRCPRSPAATADRWSRGTR